MNCFFKKMGFLLFFLLICSLPIMAENNDEFEKNKAYSMKKGTETKQTLINIETGAFVYFYKSFTTDVPQKAGSKITYDSNPVPLAYLKIDGSIPSAFFKSEFQSNLGIQSGSAKTGDEAEKAFGVSKTADYLLKIGAGLFGIESQFFISSYDTGGVKYYGSSQGSTSGFSSVDRKQFDAMYHFLWKDIKRLGGEARTRKAWDAYLGYRYLDYTTPSIVYLQTKDTAGNRIMAGESNPQNVDLKAHLGGFGINNYLRAVNPGFNWIVGFECYAGMGQAKVDFNTYKSYQPAYNASYGNQVTAGVFAPSGSLGFIYNFPVKIVTTSLKVEYKVNGYYNSFKDYQGNKVCIGHNWDTFQSINAAVEILF